MYRQEFWFLLPVCWAVVTSRKCTDRNFPGGQGGGEGPRVFVTAWPARLRCTHCTYVHYCILQSRPRGDNLCWSLSATTANSEVKLGRAGHEVLSTQKTDFFCLTLFAEKCPKNKNILKYFFLILKFTFLPFYWRITLGCSLFFTPLNINFKKTFFNRGTNLA